MNEKRLYQHAIVTYATEEEIKPLLKAAKHYAYIKHDRDYKKSESGEKVKRDTHYHIVCTWTQARSFEAVRKLVTSSQNTLVEPVKDKTCKGLMEYYTHDYETDPNKAIYDISEIIMDDTEYWQKKIEGREEKDPNEEFVDDLLDEKYNPIEMARKYGRDYIKNYNKYAEFRIRAKNEEWIDIGHRVSCVKGYDPIDALTENVNPLICQIAEDAGVNIQTVKDILNSEETLKYIMKRGKK